MWALGYHGYVQPSTVRDWMGGPDTFEVGAVGCDPFTAQLPGVGNWSVKTLSLLYDGIEYGAVRERYRETPRIGP